MASTGESQFFQDWINEALAAAEVTVDEQYGTWVTDPQPGLVAPVDESDTADTTATTGRMIHIVGLGPGDWDRTDPRTRDTLLDPSASVVVRTSSHPAAATLGSLRQVSFCDDLYRGFGTRSARSTTPSPNAC